MNYRQRLRGLYAITPDMPDEADGLAHVRAALRGGARIVQYRDKSGEAARRRTTARALRAATREFGALLIVNDDLSLALDVDADGVHLGGEDGNLAAARDALGDKILGASCYADFERARAAVRSGADYVAFGAVFASPTKPRAARADLSLFARCRAELGLPACAIGGITRENAAAVVAAGADMLAVISDIFQADGPNAIEARTRAYQPLFREEPT
jgi:thiamine-phosphate pyrophosphorylase